jgi:hypothetical protein
MIFSELKPVHPDLLLLELRRPLHLVLPPLLLVQAEQLRLLARRKLVQVHCLQAGSSALHRKADRTLSITTLGQLPGSIPDGSN